MAFRVEDIDGDEGNGKLGAGKDWKETGLSNCHVMVRSACAGPRLIFLFLSFDWWKVV